MQYDKMLPAVFLTRPNRFIAHILLEGREEICHVKNTGRCRELLSTGAKIWVQERDNPARKTRYDLITVEKAGFGLINMDAQAPNEAVYEWLLAGGCHRIDPSRWRVKREVKYGASRLDFWLEQTGNGEERQDLALEVKGVTLEQKGVALFPDAPSERAVRHLHELVRAREEGKEAAVLFVIQMKGVRFFTPNDAMDPAFGKALRRAKEAGVHLLAYDCQISPDSMCLSEEVPIRLP